MKVINLIFLSKYVCYNYFLKPYLFFLLLPLFSNNLFLDQKLKPHL